VNASHEPATPPPVSASSPSVAAVTGSQHVFGHRKSEQRSSRSKPRLGSTDEARLSELETDSSLDDASADFDDIAGVLVRTLSNSSANSSISSVDFQRAHAAEDTAGLRALRAADDAFAREQSSPAAPAVLVTPVTPVTPAKAPPPKPVAPLVVASAAPTQTRVSFREEDQTWELTKVNRKVSTLAAERDRVMARLQLAQEGYNDVGESIEMLQASLDKLNDELSSLHQRIAQLTMMPSDGAASSSGAGSSSSSSSSNNNNNNGGGAGGGGGGNGGDGAMTRAQRISARLFGRTHSQGQLLRNSAGARSALVATSQVSSAASSSESVDFDDNESESEGATPVVRTARTMRARRLDTEALKRDLGPLDPRLEIYSSSRVRNRSNSSSAPGGGEQLWWRFDHDEAERARKRAEQFERVLSFVKPRRNLVLRLSSIGKLKKLGDEPGATLYSGLWEQVKVVVRRLKSPMLAESSFLAEVRSLQRVQHAGVQMCLGVTLNPLCVVVEFVGHSLFEVLHRQHVAIDMPVVVSIGRQLAEALKVCHAAGIVHRDLNSFNILCDDNRQVKIGGFRFSSPSGEAASSGDAFVVPLEHRRWQAPELTRANAAAVVDAKVDVYSFGLLMCEIVSQEVPFASMTPDIAAWKVAFEGLRPTPPEHCRRFCASSSASRASTTSSRASRSPARSRSSTTSRAGSFLAPAPPPATRRRRCARRRAPRPSHRPPTRRPRPRRQRRRRRRRRRRPTRGAAWSSSAPTGASSGRSCPSRRPSRAPNGRRATTRSFASSRTAI
jgi:hypothetical protein